MKKRTSFITAVILLLFCSYGYTEEPEEVLSNFERYYRKKQFGRAAGLLHISNMGSMEARISVRALKNMWNAFYDRDTKLKNTEEVIRMNKEEMAVLKEEIVQMKEEGISREELENINSQLKKVKNDMKFLRGLVDVEADVSGPVIGKDVDESFAVVATRAHLSFPEEFYGEIKSFVDDARLFVPTVADKYIELEKNTLTFPVLFYLIETSSGWKVMLFSRDRFPAERFEDFMASYDISFGEFEWMAGTQAQVFWEEASLDIYHNK